MKKLQASNAFALFVFIIMCLLFTIAFASCSPQHKLCEDMIQDVIACEHNLDSIADNTTFMDTVGETDEYCDLCEAHEDFTHSRTKVAMENAYARYMVLYDKVIYMHNQCELGH